MSLAHPQRRSQAPAAVGNMYIGFPMDLVYFWKKTSPSKLHQC
jgi:hypothetical protein